MIKDAEGQVVNRVNAPTSSGLHRVSWGLHRVSAAYAGGRGPLVLPGRYTVQAEKRQAGQVTTLGRARSFKVSPLHKGVRKLADRQADLAYYDKAAALQRSVRGTAGRIGEVLGQLADIKRALTLSGRTLPALYDEAHRLTLELKALQRSLVGGSIKSSYNEPDVLSISRRISSALSTAESSFGPTDTQRGDLRIARTEFEAIEAEIRQCIEEDFVALQQALEAKKVPWTAGRPLPRD